VNKKNKYLQIFNYLKEFSKLRSKPVRDIDAQETQYPEKFWLNDIPENKLFDNVIRPEFDSENDYWLRIKKPKELVKPKFSILPGELNLWIEPTSLLNNEEMPFLQPTIELNGKVLSIDDYPELIDELDNYISQNWNKDLLEYEKAIDSYSEDYEVYERSNNTYKQYFRIFNKTLQFGEEYELVIGVGLLNFKENADCPKIFRHLVTQRVDINFDHPQKDSQIIVKPNLEIGPKVEIDSILDLENQFDPQCIVEAEKTVENFIKENSIETLFYNGMIEDALQMFVGRVSPDGKYSNSIEKPKITSSRPEVSFAPALLLRKRNTRSFTAFYGNILENIKNESDDVKISSMNDLIGVHDDIDIDYGNTDISSLQSNNEPIFFPKEYNDEQIEIIQKTRNSNKVLVQGPPGTGKSHTIANLICHLLANGKKVLITAYTKRALEVLKDKLPDEFQDLVVNLLSSDSSSIQDLQSSVNSINEELSSADLNLYQSIIEELEESLKQTKEKIALNTNDLIKIKEKTTRSVDVNSQYSGTLAQIAETLEKDSQNYEWFKDQFSDIENERIISDLEDFIEQHESYKQVDLTEFDYNVPDLNQLPEVELISEWKYLKDTLSKSYSGNEHSIIKCSNFESLKLKLSELRELYNSVDNLQIDFIGDLLKSYLNGNSNQWNQTYRNSLAVFERIDEYNLKEIDKDVDITYPSGKSLKQLKKDAQVLLKYLKEGNSLSGIVFALKKNFLPKDIKERLCFIDDVRVNGSPCDIIEEFELVLQDITIQQDLYEISELWNKGIPKGDSYFNKFSYFRNIHSEVSKLIKIINLSEAVRLEVEKMSTIKLLAFDQDNLEKIIVEAEYNSVLQKVKDFKDNFNEAEVYLNHENQHPIKNRILIAIKQEDSFAYGEVLSEIVILTNRKKQFEKFKALESDLKLVLPKLLETVQSLDFVGKDIVDIRNAIFFRNAQNEVKKLMGGDYEQQLIHDLALLENKEKRLVAKLASKKAWCKVVDGLQQDRSLRQHLNAWVMAVKKIGKTGVGKRAMKFRKIAQAEMEHCKDSVPCWIMPLYKVAETIKPEQEMFDYVIIDEASQLGPDAIFLLYISKNIIIVGDDKQTSPEYVGVDANSMTPHIKRHLNGIPFSDYYGSEFSFFDHAKFFCDGVTVLREHFRCMPEIIEFSNKNFYAPEGKGLYPLKQYSENRLEPLKAIFCANGYTEGKGARIINEPEAETIADVIADIINDEQYEGKTFGVITLQGNQQASCIENLLLKRIGEKEFHKRKIVCGNSASFQGDERDVIFLSLVTAHNHNRSALVKPEDERRFNVAVSRAKEQIWLFHSVQLDDLSNANDLRFKLLDHLKNYSSKQPILSTPIERNLGTQPEPFDSWFEVDVYNDIIRKNFSVIPQYEVAKGKYRIDLVAFSPNGTKIAIECDGDKWHGAEQYENDMMRQKVLERCGWQFFRVRAYEYYTNRNKALEPLWKMLTITDFKQCENDQEILRDQEINIARPALQSKPKEKNEIKVQEKESVEKKLDLLSDEKEREQEISIERSTSQSKPQEKIKIEPQEKEKIEENLSLFSNENKEVWESKTCIWSSVKKPGFSYAPKKKAWYKRKEDVVSKNGKNNKGGDSDKLKKASSPKELLLDEKPLGKTKESLEITDNDNKLLITRIQDVTVLKYSEKSIAVIGNTKAIKDDLKSAGGYFNSRLSKDGKKVCGWIFKLNKQEEIVRLLKQITKGSCNMENDSIYKNNVLGDFFEGVIVETFKDTTTSKIRVRPVHPDLKLMKIRFPQYLRNDYPVGTRFKVNVKISQKHVDGEPFGNTYLYCFDKSISVVEA